MSVSKTSKATMMDVANHAGVSKKTVSRVLNNEANVNENTRLKVQQAMEILDYHANMSARRLATHQSFLISMLYQDFSGNYIHDIQSGLIDKLTVHGYSLLVHPCGDDDESTLNKVESMIRQSNADGLVLIPPISDMKSVIDCLERLEKPYVRISPKGKTNPTKSVFCDDYQAAYDMTQYFIDKGHQRIGFVIGNLERRDAVVRLKGFRAAMAENKVAINEKYIVQGDFNFESGKICGEKLLTLATPPTAIFASNDHMAAGVMAAAHENDIAIPQQLSVAGVDDSPIASEIWPQLTTIRQPTQLVGEEAADKLIAQIKSSEFTCSPDLLPWQLVFRNTVAAPSS
ncbi:LacI family DNA-binding transcriptional regulator [Oceanicoccus sp. KOV_DT_Chl]|uniref:LacI family DNA-binding transcriptional regulator n=1 Tax=Oceanicoccus sp. KOV_DT_Chl TaxID=1904639 RepID=UPI000C7E4509|nr:LacI family DNA-binding transcriptional regulator [Oceanicoccus sp. KOV_DT_Chl]